MTSVSVRSLLPGVVLTSSLLVAACTTSGGPEPTPTPGQLTTSWQRIALPSDFTPVTIASDGPTIVIGAHTTARPHPGLVTGTDAGSLREVAITPHSPYAFEGRWFQVVSREGSIDAIAGARGGAHGNYRWTTWSGSPTAVTEQDQPFGVFGSYGAGDLSGMAYAAGSPVILGAWASESTGQDIATWTRTGTRWARVPSTGTPLASTPSELVGATAITSRRDGVLLSGSVTHLEDGTVTVTPAVWISPGPAGPWTRVDLSQTTPEGGSPLAEAQSATCTAQKCVVAGVVGERFAMWEVGETTTTEPPGIPTIRVTANASVLAPLSIGGKDVFVVPSHDGSTIARRSGGTWSLGEGPRGAPAAAVVAGAGAELWLVTTDPQGTGTLWRSRVA